MGQFLKMNDLQYDEVSEEFKKQYMNGLRDSGYHLTDEDVMHMQYFKVKGLSCRGIFFEDMQYSILLLCIGGSHTLCYF